MEDEQINNETKEPVVSEMAMTREAAISNEPAAPSEPLPRGNSKKTGKGIIVGLVILAVCAIGGIGFGIWAMLSQNDKISSLETALASCVNDNDIETKTTETTSSNETVIEAANSINNASAQTIVNPYLKGFGTFNNILDFEFDTNAKIKVAFDNVGANRVLSTNVEGEWAIKVRYDDLNEEYKYLFGSNQELEERDYDAPYYDFKFIDQDPKLFKVSTGGIGGTGGTMFSIVKKAYYNDDNLVVEVYHGTAPWGDGEEDEPCVAPYSLANSEEVSRYIEENADSIPVYIMTFIKDSKHYVLNNIQKQ
ncbi:hypothetical protein IKG33_02380 [Candidatus Saccharibacteria bacterium]|nr:hypothetical protein [Candidatus Saccharibacteria bacterium]